MMTMSENEDLRAELLMAKEDVRTLAQAMWNAREVLGFDNDGDTTPAAALAGMGVKWYADEHVRDAQQQRKDYDEALDEITRAEAEVERLRAVLANVVALAVEWDRLQFGSDYYAAGRERQAEVCADALRAALASVPDPYVNP